MIQRSSIWWTIGSPAVPTVAELSGMGSSFSCSSMHWRKTICPGVSLLKLRGNTNKQIFSPVGRNQLDADRQPVSIPVQRQGNCRLAGDVERRREGNELFGTPRRG